MFKTVKGREGMGIGMGVGFPLLDDLLKCSWNSMVHFFRLHH